MRGQARGFGAGSIGMSRQTSVLNLTLFLNRNLFVRFRPVKSPRAIESKMKIRIKTENQSSATCSHITATLIFESESESLTVVNPNRTAPFAGEQNQETQSTTWRSAFCSMKTTEDVRRYAAEQGIAKEEALGTEAKSKEFVEKGAEVYAKV